MKASKVITTIIKKSTTLTEAVTEVIKSEGLTIQQFNVLRILSGRKGKPARLSDITCHMIHSNSNTTRVIDKLIQKKLVKRKQSSSDRRQVDITITKEGLAMLSKIDQPLDQKENTLIENLTTSEKEQLVEILSKI